MSTVIVTMPRRELAAALSRLNATAPRSSAREALKCARLSLSDRFELAATDIDRVHTERVEAVSVEAASGSADGRGLALVNVAEFAKATAATKTRNVRLMIDAAGVVNVDGLRLSPAPSVAEFPKLSHLLDDCDASGKPLENIGGAIVDAAELAAMLGFTMFATDTNASRYALGGCLFEVCAGSLGGLRIIGTDGRRLSQTRTAAEPENAAGDYSAAVVPVDALRVIARQCSKAAKAKTAVVELFRRYAEPAPAEPATADGGLTVQPPADPPAAAELKPTTGAADYVRVALFDAAGDAVAIVTTRTVEGRYPNWRQVKPRELGNRGTVRVDELAAVTRRALSIVERDNRGVDIALRERVAIVKTRQPSGCAVRDALRLSGADPFDAAATLRFTLDVKFIDDIAKAAGAAGLSTLGIEATVAESPVIFTLGGFGYYVVMPMARTRNVANRRAERCRRIDAANEAAAAELAAAEQSSEPSAEQPAADPLAA